MEDVKDFVGDVREGRGSGSRVARNAVTSFGSDRDEREITRTNKGRVIFELDKRSRANEYGAELEYGEALTRPSGHRRLDVEEDDFRPLFRHGWSLSRNSRPGGRKWETRSGAVLFHKAPNGEIYGEEEDIASLFCRFHCLLCRVRLLFFAGGGG